MLSLFTALILAWNFTFLIYPYSHAATNEVLAFAQDRRNDWSPNTAVAYSHFHSDLWTISYFNPQVQWIEVTADTGRLEEMQEAGRQKGVSLWLDGAVYDAIGATDAGKAWIGRHVDRERSLIYESRAHRIRFFRMRERPANPAGP